MKARTGVLALLFMVVCVTGCSQETFSPELEPKPLKRVLASKNEYYGPAAPALKKQLISENRNGVTNHFCVVGYVISERTTNVWVHWVEQQRLILWDPSTDPEQRERGLLISRRDLKLGKDTVETADDINGSTYLVTRGWWEAIAKDCEAHGERYTVEPFTAPPATMEEQ